MGFLDSYFRLTSMTDEMAEKSDVGASLSSMQTKLDALNATMAPPVAADPAKRVDATATVSAARPTGAQVNGAQVIELDLIVMLPAGIPMPVTATTLVPLTEIGRVGAGSRLAVSLDPAAPVTLVVEWSRAV
ncbi:MAG: hypothetical protein BGO97_03950 [Micrococcales bacterium 70-64]|nr:hypothetical protein [Leifsonia sp.]ODU63263.1 MAG: hypothetical protein ABT06_03955 [Leifsonia sp. SCN 70-46]OJX84954.1 MAG: hypothetical protein BGO97_03950 [Micrococcales bacterium 70-64]